MIDSLKAIGSYTAKGAMTGAVIGTCAGLAQIPLICGVSGMTGLFFHQFLNGKSPSNLDAAWNVFDSCKANLPLVGATGGALCGAGLGFICAVIKEICKNYTINVQRVHQN